MPARCYDGGRRRCGRFTITDLREQQLRFGFVDFHETRPLSAMPRFNVAPSQTEPMVVEDADPLDMLGDLGPYPEDLMTGYPVSRAVNTVANDGPELVEPLPSG